MKLYQFSGHHIKITGNARISTEIWQGTEESVNVLTKLSQQIGRMTQW